MIGSESERERGKREVDIGTTPPESIKHRIVNQICHGFDATYLESIVVVWRKLTNRRQSESLTSIDKVRITPSSAEFKYLAKYSRTEADRYTSIIGVSDVW